MECFDVSKLPTLRNFTIFRISHAETDTAFLLTLRRPSKPVSVRFFRRSFDRSFLYLFIF